MVRMRSSAVRARHQRAAEGEAIIAQLRHRATSSRQWARMKIAIAVDVVERRGAAAASPASGASRGDRDDVGIVGIEQRLAERGAMDFELGKRLALEALDDAPDRPALMCASSSASAGSRAPRCSCISAQRCADETSTSLRAGLAVLPAVLARLVDVEIVMRVLHGRDA